MIKRWARKFRAFMTRTIDQRQEQILMELGRMQARQNLVPGAVKRLQDAEFRVFSQHAEDGIIQYLCAVVPLGSHSFVEFGVQDYRESNTRFLLTKDHWQGLIIDAGDAHVRYVNHEGWLGVDHDLATLQAFITQDNIEALLARMPEDLGLLSVDIDGNDYWILQAITRVKPRILILEYNSFFGPDLSLSIPYAERFDRMAAHSSGYYFGASLQALTDLANAKGYALVGCDSHGVNAFYVRREFLGSLPELAVKEAFVALTPGGGMQFPEPLKRIASLPLTDTRSLKTQAISAWFPLEGSHK